MFTEYTFLDSVSIRINPESCTIESIYFKDDNVEVNADKNNFQDVINGTFITAAHCNPDTFISMLQHIDCVKDTFAKTALGKVSCLRNVTSCTVSADVLKFIDNMKLT